MSKPTKAALAARFKGKQAPPFGKPKAAPKPSSKPATKGKGR